MTTAPTRRDAASSPSPRGRLMRFSDRALSRLLRLPPAVMDYTVARAIPVRVRDGVELLADHYAPATSAPAGTLLVRGPYGRRAPGSILYARLYAERGYHVVLQSARGTFGSGGVFDPAKNEVADGADTVAWLRRQPWFTGRFGTVGPSYLGYTQWALLVDPPPELAAAVITVGPHDFGAAVWGTGAFALSDFLGWSDLVTRQDGPRRKTLISAAMAPRRLRSAMAGLPLGAAGRTLLGEGAPWYESWLEHPDVTAEYWQPSRLHTALDRVQVPVLLIGGWQDIFLRQTLHQYRHLRNRGVHVGLTVGPWTHMQTAILGAGICARESHEWLAEHLAGTGMHRRSNPVRVFATGGPGWRDLPDWPPASADNVLYLQPGALGEKPPPSGASPSRFTYDPADPTPTVGGRMLSIAGGYRNDTRLADRADVLSFTGPTLTADLDVIGTPYVELAHSTDNPYADVLVRLSEVDRKGRSRNVSDGYVRLGPEPAAPLRVQLDAIAHRFRRGSRIRLLVAGGSHPRFARNLGTGDPPLTNSRLARATHTVAHGGGGISRLVLPVEP